MIIIFLYSLSLSPSLVLHFSSLNHYDHHLPKLPKHKEVMRKKMGINQMPINAVMMPEMGLKTGSGGTAAKGGAAAASVKEKTTFELKLEGGFDSGSKIKIIKEVRTFTDLGLKEAKKLVEKAPTMLKKGVAKEEAEKSIENMKAIGAKVVME
ncbi:putative ribosomal protein L7/L12 [Helianthus annuus]|nr:putative ribosomal protein L7/L12 [Helianthus annuus]